MKKPSRNSTRQINKSYHSRLKALIKGQHEREIFDALSAGKNSYLRLDRLESSSFDKSWIEVIEDVIFDLGEIIANPRMHTKTEGVLTPVELAKKTNSESVQHLASHTQYVKEVDEYGNVIPSKLLSITSDDDLHTYENRFIATLVRRLVLFIEKRYEFVSQFAELQNEEILYFKNKSIVDGATVEIETKVKVSYKNDDNEAIQSSNYIERIAETRRYILYFYNSPFMKAMKNEKDVRNPIIQTNIIRKNPKYHHCYEVYRFIETYDRLGVSYKIDENYSLFNKEELDELNRTLMANYLTLKGREMSRQHKTNTKIYKPRILTSLEDESFIYGPLLEGPISFARVDEQYQAYLDSKIKKDLPLHPTKAEKEYYADEYAAKAENKQDLKQKNDLLKRRQKEVNEFERQVKKILANREDAMRKLLELEKQAIKQEEFDLLEAARREIIAASKEDMQQEVAAQEEAFKEEQNRVYTPTVTFDEAADEIWPQLSNPTPIVVAKKEEQPAPVKKAAPVQEVKPVPEAKPVVKEQPKEEAPVIKKEYVPTVSFNDAANEIWPQLNNPTPLAKEERIFKPIEKPTPVKVVKATKEPKVVPQAEQPVDKKEYVPTVSFDDAADEIWPQLNNPKPLPKEKAKVEQPKQVAPKTVKKKPAPVAPVKEEKVAPKEAPKKEYHPTIKFDEAADEIWPQLKNPTPLKEEVKEVTPEENKPAPKKVSLPKSEPVKKQPVVKEKKVAEKKEQPKEAPKAKKPAPKKAAPKAKPQPKKEEQPAPVVPERKKIPGNFIVKTPKGYYVGQNKYSINKEEAFVFDDYNLASDIKKEKGGKIVRV